MMKQMIRITRKADIEKQYAKLLKLDIDYLLLTLRDALAAGRVEEVAMLKAELGHLSDELNAQKAI